MSTSSSMERASRLLGKLGLPGDTIRAEQLACAAWAGAVGRKVAAHSRAVRMVRTSLIVEVDDDTWRKPLFTLRRQILGRLAKDIGAGLVEEIEFQVRPARLGPRRAERSTFTLTSTDEADRIEDPGLRRIYKAARKKALA